MTIANIPSIISACGSILSTLVLLGIRTQVFKNTVPAATKFFLFLIIATFALSGLTYCRINYGHPTPENSESYVTQWVADLKLTNRKLPSDERFFWAYEIGPSSGGGNMITVSRSKDKSAYLTFSAAIIFPKPLREFFANSPPGMVSWFKTEYIAELCKARTMAQIDKAFSRADIARVVPITPEVDELTFVNTLNAMFQDESIVGNEIPLCMIRAGVTADSLPQPSATPSPLP